MGRGYDRRSMPEIGADVRAFAPTLDAQLARAFPGARVHDAALVGGPRPRSHVWRCLLDGFGAPRSIIVKSMRGTDWQDYDPSARDPESSVARLAREYAGARLLSGIERPLAPCVHAIDVQHGYLVLEDLGTGGNLAQVLLNPDASPDQATATLRLYADALAAQHAATLGRQADYAAMLAEVSDDACIITAAVRPATHDSADWLAADVPAFLGVCAQLGIGLDARALHDECAAIADLLDNAGAWLALSSGDCCPDNHILTPAGLRFLDFEGGTYRHALLDLAYLHLPFPTCWAVKRLPEAAVTQAMSAYRARLAQDHPALARDDNLDRTLAQVCAFWALRTLNLRRDKHFHLSAVLEADAVWGRATLRQRHVLRLNNAAALCMQQGVLPALSTTMLDLAATLRMRWGEPAEMPLYPAFASRQ